MKFSEQELQVLAAGMNKWQMDGNTISWRSGGGVGTDNKGMMHTSIHPRGRRRKKKDTETE